jgi:hypothetical protein
MKRSKIILSIILVVLAAVVSHIVRLRPIRSLYNYKDYIVGGASYDTDVRKIDIDWISGNVSIYAYDGETVNGYEESEIELKETEKLRCRLNGGSWTQVRRAQHKAPPHGLKSASMWKYPRQSRRLYRN